MLSPPGYSFSRVVRASPLVFMASPKCVRLYRKCLWLSQSVYSYFQVHKATFQMFMAISSGFRYRQMFMASPHLMRLSWSVYGSS